MHKSLLNQVTDSCSRTLCVAHLHIIPQIMLLFLWLLFDLLLPFHPLGVVGIIPFYGQQCTACCYGMPYVVSGDGRMMYHKGTFLMSQCGWKRRKRKPEGHTYMKLLESPPVSAPSTVHAW